MTQSNEKKKVKENSQLSIEDNYIEKISKDTNIPLELTIINLISSFKEYNYQNALVEKTLVKMGETRYHALNVRGIFVRISVNKEENRFTTWMRNNPFVGIYLFNFSHYKTINEDVIISALKANDLWSEKYHSAYFNHSDETEEEKKLNFREQIHEQASQT